MTVVRTKLGAATEKRSNGGPPVPFVDLGLTNRPLKAVILAEIGELIDDGSFVNGPQVGEFEDAFARSCGTSHAVAVASGLDALRFALLALGLQHGDEVILPANTFAATLEAVLQAGGTPVLVDASLNDYNVDPEAVAAAISPWTRVILPVHLYGQLANMDALTRLAARHGLAIVEDACQAHGATRDGHEAGNSGTAAAFSFYPAKNLGAFGDGGALVTNDAEIADDARALREHGQRGKYQHDIVGYTGRLDTLQAIVLLRKLPLLSTWNDQRHEAAKRYFELLEDVKDLVLPPVVAGSAPVWHLYVVRTSRRAELADYLAGRGIGTGRHYPQPLHLAPAFSHLGYHAGAFPVSEALAEQALSLPIFPGITEAQIGAVAQAVRDFFFGGG